MKCLKIAVLVALATSVTLVGGSFRKSQAQDTDPTKTPKTPGELVILGKDGKSAGACPLKHTDVDAEISGFIARVSVVQEFHNPTTEKIEAIYTFPLPEDSAVDAMEMTVGKRTIVGEIRRREEARQIYEAAKEAGHVASLLDQERSNIFTQSVANIMPGEKVTIRISYTQLLKYEAGRYEFVFPMVVGPRYIPGDVATGKEGTGWSPDTNEVPDASKITPPVTPEGTRAGHDISVKAAINAGIPIYAVKSELHEVVTDQPNETSAVVKLKNKAEIPNKDFVLRYDVAGEAVQNGLITHAPTSNNGGFFTLIFQPPKEVKQRFVTPKQMIFVQDTSGSQRGEPIAKSKETMYHCIKNMNPGDTFNLIAFSNSPRMLFDEPRDYNAESEGKALKYMQEFEGNGGTEIIPALKVALAQPADPKRLTILVVFSDGYVGSDMAIVDYLQKNLGNRRVFVMGIGGSVNRFLIEKMAEVGRGAPDFVFLNSKGEEIARKFYERIRSPLVTDIEIDWGGLPVVADEIYPKRVPDLFGAQPVVVKGRYTRSASGEITIRGKAAGQAWVRKLQVTLPELQPGNDSLASIWARAKVEDLMDKDWLGAQQGKPNEDVKEQIVDVALTYHLMTQYTSFVAAEKMIVTDGGTPKTIAVPVEMPEGVSYEGVFGSELAAEQRGVRFTGAVNTFALSAGRGYGGYGGTGNAPAAPAAPMASAGTVVMKDGYADAAALSVEETLEQKKDRLIKTRLDKVLVDLVEKLRKSGESALNSIPGKLMISDGKVEVMIWVKGVSDEKIEAMTKLGLTDNKWLVQDKILIGWVPVARLEELAQLESIARIAPPGYVK